uniref:Family with sequence similarity 113 n=1 Tax=Chelydra serpentina TaxID=8475 RepID=A0A8C3S069_CHESE
MITFFTHEVQQLLHNKFVVIVGDSIQRAVYKDLVLLLQKDALLSQSQLKAKGELSFENDRLVEGGVLGELTNGTNYREVRQYRSDHHLVRFYFVTRVYSDYVESILADFQVGPQPDVVIINSCLWDVSRYGPKSMKEYRVNLEKAFNRLDKVLPHACLLVWNMTMPVGHKIIGGFLIPGVRQTKLPHHVIEGNFYGAVLASSHHFDVLDLHYYFRFDGHHRSGDGVHWDRAVHRRITHLLLAHVADAWGVEIPEKRPQDGEWGRGADSGSPPDGRPGTKEKRVQRSGGTWRYLAWHRAGQSSVGDRPGSSHRRGHAGDSHGPEQERLFPALCSAFGGGERGSPAARNGGRLGSWMGTWGGGWWEGCWSVHTPCGTALLTLCPAVSLRETPVPHSGGASIGEGEALLRGMGEGWACCCWEWEGGGKEGVGRRGERAVARGDGRQGGCRGGGGRAAGGETGVLCRCGWEMGVAGRREGRQGCCAGVGGRWGWCAAAGGEGETWGGCRGGEGGAAVGGGRAADGSAFPFRLLSGTRSGVGLAARPLPGAPRCSALPLG